jgi:drug/metabolite transporter (DMT)-like permease
MMQTFKTYLAAVLAILFWGLSFIWSGRLVSRGIPVEYFLPVRIFLAAVLLLGYNLIRGYKMKIRRPDMFTFLLLAACEPFIYFFCETYGIQFTGSPTISSLVIASTPVLAIVAGVVFFKEHITWQHIAGMVICLVGLVLVTRAHGGNSRLFYFGLGVLVLAVVSEVAYASITKSLSGGYKPTVIVMHQFFIGSVLFFPLFLTRGMENYDPAIYGGWGFWQPLLCLTVLCSTVAFTLWAYAIGGLGVAKSSVFQALNPVVTALAGYILGDEILHGGQWVGLGIAVAGVILTQLNIGKKNLFEKKS